MKTTTYLLFFLSTSLFGQEAKWLNTEHVLNKDKFYKTEYVNSATQPMIVNCLMQETPPVPNGPSTPPKFYLFAYDTSGTAQWNLEVKFMKPLEILSVDPEKFWIIGTGSSAVQIGNQAVINGFSYPTFKTMYFIELTKTGTVLNTITAAIAGDTYFSVTDITSDKNGDFVFCGTVYPDQLTQVPFTYGTFTTTLMPNEKLFFVTKMKKNGIAGPFYSVRSPRFIQPYTMIQQVSCDPFNGRILFTGRQGDSLMAGNNYYLNNSGFPQFFVGTLDSTFNQLAFNASYFSTRGPLINEATFNKTDSSFYLIGNWGNQLSYGVAQPVQGHTGSVNNSFILKLKPNSLVTDSIFTCIPQNNSVLNFINLSDISVAGDGTMYVCGYVTDSTVNMGNTMYAFNNGLPYTDYESILIRISPGMVVDTVLASSDNGNSLFTSLAIHGRDVYCSGNYFNGFSMCGLNSSSVPPGSEGDALLLRFYDENLPLIHEGVNTGVTLNKTLHPELIIYPNPSKAEVYLKLPDVLKEQPIVEITDGYGRSVSPASVFIPNSTIYLDLKFLAPGMYFITVHNGSQRLTKKLLIE